MKPNKTIVALAIIHCAVCAALCAPPANDLFENRAPLAGKNVSTTANNSEATAEANEPDPLSGNPAGKSLWWTWTAPESGAVTISTADSSFDTVLAVYTGTSLSNLVALGSDDDSGPGSTSTFTFFATAGTAYAITVDGYFSGEETLSGDIQLNVGFDEFRFKLDSFTFAELLKDYVATGTENGHVFYELRDKYAGTAKAVLTVPGLHGLSSAAWAASSFSLSFDDTIFFQDTLSNADSLTTSRAAFTLVGEDSDGNPVRAGQMVFTRSGDKLTITIEATNSEYSIDVFSYYDEEGPISGNLPFEFSMNSLTLVRNIYVTGSNNITAKAVPGDFGDDYLFLNNIRLSGRSDSTAPSVELISPAPGARLTNEVVLVQVRATDLHGVSDVQFSLNSGRFQSGERTDPDLWSIEYALVPGTNIIGFTATDEEGNTTNGAVKVYYARVSPVNIFITGDGTVSGATDGELLEIGKTYTIKARPAPGSIIFAISSGGVSKFGPGTAAPMSCTFEMKEETFIEVSFTPNPFVELKGTYRGLLETPAYAYTSWPPRRGSFTLKLTDKGTFSGTVQLSDRKFPISGRFSALRDARYPLTNSRKLGFSLSFTGWGGG